MNKFYYKDGSILGYLDKNRTLHRTDGPAVEEDGNKKWFINGIRHRDDGPAVEYKNGSKFWYQNNLLHRDDGPAAVRSDGSVGWYFQGEFHREDGPALITNLSEGWYFRNKIHRIDGPAITYTSSGKSIYFVDGTRFESLESYLREVETIKNLPLELKLLDHREWVRKLATSALKKIK